MPNFSALKDRIGSLTQMHDKLKQLSEKCAAKSNEADVYKKCYDGLLSEYANALAESKYFAARLDKTRKEKEKLEEKQTEGPLDIVKIISEMKFEIHTIYDVFKNYHRAVQKVVPVAMESIMYNQDPKQVVESIKKQLDVATLEASARMLLENELPSNQALKFGEYLEKTTFKALSEKPIVDPNNPESMEMDT